MFPRLTDSHAPSTHGTQNQNQEGEHHDLGETRASAACDNSIGDRVPLHYMPVCLLSARTQRDTICIHEMKKASDGGARCHMAVCRACEEWGCGEVQCSVWAPLGQREQKVRPADNRTVNIRHTSRRLNFTLLLLPTEKEKLRLPSPRSVVVS